MTSSARARHRASDWMMIMIMTIMIMTMVDESCSSVSKSETGRQRPSPCGSQKHHPISTKREKVSFGEDTSVCPLPLQLTTCSFPCGVLF